MTTQPAASESLVLRGFDCAVVHEADAIGEPALAAAVSWLANRPGVHLAAADAVHPLRDGVSWRTYPSKRSGEFRDYAIARVEQALAAALGNKPAPTICGVDVAQVALIDWAQSCGDAIVKERICRALLDAGVGDVLWMADQAKYAREYAAAACDSLRRRGVRATCLPDAATGASRLRVLRMKNGAAAAARATRGLMTPRVEPPAPTSGRPRVVFAENYPKTAKVAAGAAKELEAAGDVDVWFIVTRADTAAAVRACGVRGVVLLDALVRKGAWLRSLDAQRRMGDAALTFDTGPDGDLLGAQFAMATAANWRYAAHMTVLWHDVLSWIRPHAVATTSQANIFARAATAVGHEMGAASYFIQHGLLGHDRFESRVTAQRQLLWGEWDRRQRIALGFPPDSLSVTGYPNVDATPSAESARDEWWSAGAALKLLYLPSLTTGQWVSPANAAHLRDAVVDAARRMPGAELVIKVHPSERSDAFDSWNARVVREGTAPRLIRHADAVIVSTSTSGLEACALDKPVIVLKADGVRVFPQYEAHGAVLFAQDADGLLEHLQSLRDDPELRSRLQHGRRDMTDDLFDGMRPGAAVRIADAIRSGACEASQRAVRRQA